MSRKPNVLVFFSDQQRWDTAGCYGNPMGLTPNLDAMADRGVRLERSFTVQPVCGPARACLQTGLYATQNGCFHNGIPLPENAPTLAKAFGAAGYWTGYVGKWHLASVRHEGEIFGRESAVPPRQRGGYADLWQAADLLEFASRPDRFRVFDGDGRDVERPGYRVDAQTDLLLEALEVRARDRDRPFLLFASFIEPHHQNDLDEFVGPPGRAEALAGRLHVPPDLARLGGSSGHHLPGYYACIEALDRNLGRVLAALRRLGLDGETVVLYTSDHGNHFKTRNDEYKRSGHEASLRVPTVFQGPGFDGRGPVRELVTLLDWHATLLDAAGLPPLPGSGGRSVLPLLAGRRDGWPREVFAQTSEAEVGRVLRTDRWKYGVVAPDRDPWKDAGSSEYVEAYLYDLDRDPAELDNRVDDAGLAGIRAELTRALVRRMADAGEAPPAIRPRTVR